MPNIQHDAEKSCVLTEEQALQLIAFLTSAAEISIHEPTYYGTFRLIDGASRLIGFMLEHDPPRSGAFLRELKTELDTKKVWMMWDREAYFDFLRATPAQVAAEVKRLADETPPSSGGGLGGESPPSGRGGLGGETARGEVAG